MKILLVTTHTYLPDRYGGSESSTHDLCITLIEHGDSVAVLCRSNVSHDSQGARVDVDSSTADIVETDLQLGYPVFRALHPVRSIKWAVETWSPDVAVVQSGKQVPCAEELGSCGMPTVVCIRDARFSHIGGVPSHASGRLFLANSRFTAEAVLNTFGILCEVIPPMVVPSRYTCNPVGEYLTFINPIPLKGYDTALAIARSRCDIPMLMVESWPLTDEYRASIVASTEKLPNVTLHRGTMDMREIYSRTKVLLVPSVWAEAWGRVVSESQLSGIPSLASDIGGLPESVGPGGILVNPDQPLTTWLTALDRIWNFPDTYRELSQRAKVFSQRPAIHPDNLVTNFRNALERCRRSAL